MHAQFAGVHKIRFIGIRSPFSAVDTVIIKDANDE